MKFGTAFDSDYMLLSPVVDVFRNIDLEFIPKPYTTAVMTIPAPNLFDRAYGQSKEALDRVMKKRLRQYMYCAARFGYRTITLGAWGCGAFGHDARNVAGYFKELLVEEKCGSCLIKLYLLFMEEETASIIIKCLKRYWEREKTVRFIMNKNTYNYCM